MKRYLVSLFVGLTALATALPASASSVATTIRPQQGSPIQITSCTANVQFISNGWGTSYSNLNTAVDFKNTSQSQAVAVLFRLKLSSVFGNVIDNNFAQATGHFDSGATINGNHWSATDTWPGLGSVECTVERVLYSDGSVWTEPKPAPSPSASPT